MSSGARLKAVLAVVVIVLIAGVAWFVVSGSRSEVAPAVAPPPAAKAAIPEAAPVPVPVSRPASAPLPSLKAPLPLVIEDLKKRAAAGEAPSACRLAAEYSHCDRLRYRRADDARWLIEREQAIGSLDDPEAIKLASASIEREMALRDRRTGQLAAHCGNVALPEPSEMARQWRQAALLGSRAAMKEYASGNGFRWNSMMSSIPELAAYRNEAERMALTLAREGDVDMMLALASGYDPTPASNRSLLAQSTAPDGARALALYRRVHGSLNADGPPGQASLRRRVEMQMRQIEEGLDPSGLARADELQRGEFATWAAPVIDAQLPEFLSVRRQGVGRADCAR